MNNGNTEMKTVSAWVDGVLKASVVAVGIVGGILSWQFQQALASVRDHDVAIARIEANRYTAQDAINDFRQLSIEIQGLRSWVETNYPPKSLLEDIQEIKDANRELRAEIRELRDAIRTQ